MGRYNFRPSRIHQATARLLATERLSRKPPWYDVIEGNPPSQILVRTQPVQHSNAHPKSGKGKPSKAFRPQRISYKEDDLRKTFFSDHPWELARPRVVLEDDGKDYQRQDWSSLSAPGNAPSGESVVQRQLFLMQESKMTRDQAYHQARKEFYEHRLREDVERRVAKEEASATGACFGKSYVQVGAELEDESYEQWRAWAAQTYTEMEQKRSGQTLVPSSDSSAEETTGDSELAAGLDAVGGEPVLEAGRNTRGTTP